MASTKAPLGYLVKRVQSSLRRVMDMELGKVGLSMAQYAALHALAEEPGLTNAALADRCFVTPQTMIRIVNAFETAGWVERSEDPANRRRLLAALTPEGRALARRGEAIAARVDSGMVEGLSETDRRRLRSALSICLDSLGKMSR